jgi:hypothetical protein
MSARLLKILSVAISGHGCRAATPVPAGRRAAAGRVHGRAILLAQVHPFGLALMGFARATYFDPIRTRERLPATGLALSLLRAADAGVQLSSREGDAQLTCERRALDRASRRRWKPGVQHRRGTRHMQPAQAHAQARAVTGSVSGVGTVPHRRGGVASWACSQVPARPARVDRRMWLLGATPACAWNPVACSALARLACSSADQRPGISLPVRHPALQPSG